MTRAKSGGSVLTPEALGEALELHRQILNMTAEFEGSQVRYSDVCREVGSSCQRERGEASGVLRRKEGGCHAHTRGRQ